MKLGIRLPAVGPAATPRNLAAVATEVERLGFDAVSLGDHVVLPYEVHSVYLNNPSRPASSDGSRPFLDPFVTLSYVAARTERVKLVLAVCVVPYRNPLHVAKMVATVDHLSAGRMVFGVGLGWMAEEFAALGVPFADRGKRTDEYIRVFKTLWKEGHAAFQGEFVQCPEVGCFPLPTQRPGPPIMVGGHSHMALRRAVELGEGWIASGLSPKDMEVGLKDLRSICAKRGRDPATLQSIVSFDTFVDGSGSVGFRAKFGGEDGDARNASGMPLETALHEYARLGVDLAILRFPEVALTANLSVLEKVKSLSF